MHDIEQDERDVQEAIAASFKDTQSPNDDVHTPDTGNILPKDSHLDRPTNNEGRLLGRMSEFDTKYTFKEDIKKLPP